MDAKKPAIKGYGRNRVANELSRQDPDSLLLSGEHSGPALTLELGESNLMEQLSGKNLDLGNTASVSLSSPTREFNALDSSLFAGIEPNSSSSQSSEHSIVERNAEALVEERYGQPRPDSFGSALSLEEFQEKDLDSSSRQGSEDLGHESIIDTHPASGDIVPNASDKDDNDIALSPPEDDLDLDLYPVHRVDDHPPSSPGELAAKPVKRQKISKKELELAQKISRKLERGMELAPAARTTKKFTANAFIDDFENSANSEEAMPSETTDISNDPFSSPSRRQDQLSSPPSSPTSPSRGKENAAKLMHELKTTKPLDASSSPLSKFHITPKRLTSFVNNEREGKLKSEQGESDDSDLEIEFVAPTKAMTTPASIKNLAKFSRFNLYQESAKAKSKGVAAAAPAVMRQNSLLLQLNSKQREQAIKSKQERIAAIEARGGKVLTDEQKKREDEIVESALERERRRAEEILKREQLEGSADESDDEEDKGGEYIPSDEDEFEDPVGDIEDDESSGDNDSEEELEDLFDNLSTAPSAHTQEPRGSQEHNQEKEQSPELDRESEEAMPVSEDSDEELVPRDRRKGRRRAIVDDDVISDVEISESGHADDTLLLLDGNQGDESLSQFFESTMPVGTDDTQPTQARLDQLRALENQRAESRVTAPDRKPPALSDAASPLQSPQVEAHASDENDEDESEGDEDERNLVSAPKYTAQRRAKVSTEAKLAIDDEAMESEDEWAGIGGASDDDAEEDNAGGYNLANLVDDVTKVKMNEAELRMYDAENELQKDEELVNRLMEDVTNGGWRKRRKGVDGAILDEFLDEDDMEAYYLSAMRMREEKRRRRLLEEANLNDLASNPKTKAFVESIVDNSTKAFDLSEPSQPSQSDDQDQNSRDGTQNANGNADGASTTKNPSKRWTTDLIRQSLSFLDEPSEAELLKQKALDALQSKTATEVEFSLDDDDSDRELEEFVKKSASVRVIDRMAARQSMASTATKNRSDAVLPFAMASHRSVSSQVKAAKLAKDVEVHDSLPGAAVVPIPKPNARKQKMPSRVLRVAESGGSGGKVSTPTAGVKRKSTAKLFSGGEWS